ncbi:ABC transporter ATP-binding protein [Rubellicoccus peritrichatus]|uniref:ABC transporter ATP-binding protein n=1 Tax=Rubellicoccus peritrichatus TaxID=3080537 RepID=A0AAQ3LBM4_9BACT|nr:ABC transporter ATP-binding protein [Puniceicoccus sp. CR14]WOO40885.1 ABC transporter ATP-binding protein [Puniceicoccus sp. CR14]
MPDRISDSVPAIRISQMRVDYESFTAVKGLDLSIHAGQIFGLIGPNGAGKTSTFKVLATLLEPTYGEVAIGGFDVAEQPKEARQVLGYMQDLAPVPSDLKVWEFLDCFAQAYGLSKSERKARIGECLELVELTEKRNAFCKSLSRGMTQRVVLAKSLLHSPKVMLLDEPASGMDPVSRVRLREILQKLARDGVAILISSHILTELSSVCTEVGILNHGELLDSGPTHEVVERMSAGHNFRGVRLKLLESSAELARVLDKHQDIFDMAVSEREIRFKFSGTPAEQVALLKELMNQDFAICSFEEIANNIEDILLNLNVPQSSNASIAASPKAK